MFSLIYIEKEVADHPRVVELCRRFSSHSTVLIDHYMEVFNRRAQNFRVQKRLPALILARKHQNFVLKTPPGYGIGSPTNYYFSHLLNCPFDCRYCFLQGMYQSAHFVFFVNQEDFHDSLCTIDGEETTFFTGYDCDSLAFESVTGFAKKWLPWVAQHKGTFEFRTKSTFIRPFLEHKPLENCVVAYTLSPHEVSSRFEHKAPSFSKRLGAMEVLQNKGWKLGLRFDPVISLPRAVEIYQTFFKEVFERLSLKSIHSVSLGGFRVPKQVLKNMVAIHPKEPLLAQNEEGQNELLQVCKQEVLNYVSKEQFFPCYE